MAECIPIFSGGCNLFVEYPNRKREREKTTQVSTLSNFNIVTAKFGLNFHCAACFTFMFAFNKRFCYKFAKQTNMVQNFFSWIMMIFMIMSLKYKFGVGFLWLDDPNVCKYPDTEWRGRQRENSKNRIHTLCVPRTLSMTFYCECVCTILCRKT